MAYLAVIKSTIPDNTVSYVPNASTSSAYATCLSNGDVLSTSSTQLGSGVTVTLIIWRDKIAHDNFFSATAADVAARDAHNTANGITLTKTTYVI